MQSAECRKAGQSHSKVGFGATRSAARQSRNRSLEGLAAEHVHVRIRALPPERRIYAAVGRKTRPLPHKCGVPAHGSPESGGQCPDAPCVHLPQRCYGGRAENSENRLPPASPSAYSAYSAVYLLLENLLRLRTISTIAVEYRAGDSVHPPTRGLPRTRIVPPRKCRRKAVWISLADQKRGFEGVLWV